MPRSRSRSRERAPLGGSKVTISSDKRDGIGNSESDIVKVAIKQLTPKIRDRLESLFTEGLLKENDLDLRSITVFASLNEGLQDRVMSHMENERIYVANARSKSGFLIATCDKAKTGCLDARGLGAIDPWRSALVAMATPKQRIAQLQPEADWITEHGDDPVRFHVDVGISEGDIGMSRVIVEVSLLDSATAIKAKLSALGVKMSENQMKLHTESVGFVKDATSFAYYNLKDGAEFKLSKRARAGSRFRRDHAVPLKRPRTQERAAQTQVLAKLPAGLPSLPALPGLPSLPGLPGASPCTFPGGAAALAKFAAPNLGALLGTLGKAGACSQAALPGLPHGLPGLSAGAMPGLAAPSLDPAVLAKLGLGGMPTAVPGSMPNLGAMAGLFAANGQPKLGAALDLSALSALRPAGATAKACMAAS